MFSAFAYSEQMQIILVLTSFVQTFFCMYLMACLITHIYGERASIKRKAAFAFLTGICMPSIPVYLIYLLSGMRSFTPVQYLIFTNINPISAVLFCCLGIKVLKLPPMRSVKLMGHICLQGIIMDTFNRTITSIWFSQPDPLNHYNFLLSATQLVVYMALFFAIYKATMYLLNRRHATFISNVVPFAHPKRDWLFFFAKTCLIYACLTVIPMFVPGEVFANIIILFVLSLFFVTTILFNLYQQVATDSRNKAAHINTLIRSSDNFRALKHDFNNVLQTYNGYFALGDFAACKKYHDSLVHTTRHVGDALDLSLRMAENPALISLLVDKIEHAESKDVLLDISLKCPLADLPIRDFDISRIIAFLLDNAIAAASEAEQKRVFFSIENRPNDSRLIIITNSMPPLPNTTSTFTAGSIDKSGYFSIGLNHVRKIISKYANCTFQMNCYHNEMTAYVELRKCHDNPALNL